MPAIDRLLSIMARLRDPERGCPWDLEQDFASIAPHTIEEAYEVEDAITRGDMPAFREELGDLLLQVVFHAQMAQEQGLFDFDAVAATLCDKLVSRHPHVFAGASVESAEEQTRVWEDLKAKERAAKASSDAVPSALDGIALGLPALLRTQKLLRRIDRAGLAAASGEPDEAWARFRAERDEASLGAFLIALAAEAGRHGIDAERALRAATSVLEAEVRRDEASGRL